MIAVSPMNKLYVEGICASARASDQSGCMASILTFAVSAGVGSGSGSGSGSGVGSGVGTGSGMTGSSAQAEAKRRRESGNTPVKRLMNLKTGGGKIAYSPFLCRQALPYVDMFKKRRHHDKHCFAAKNRQIV
ncbi:hypothetical protein B5F77_00805 [Parabacteroides sp. An277]|nr:hypothetical protein B5F77_00805 [Parabacteroides sp. An277]